MTVNINGETVMEGEIYRADQDQNIFLLNSATGRTPSHGAVTEVTVWRRLLSEQEIRDALFQLIN